MKRFVCLKTTPRFGPGAIKLQHRRAARAEHDPLDASPRRALRRSMASEPSPAQRAVQITFVLKGHLKNVQISYIRAAALLAKVRDEGLYRALKHDSMESYAAERLGLQRAALYRYLQIHDWIRRSHREWLAQHPKGFIPELSDAYALMWIEERLEDTALEPQTHAELEALRQKALAGKLTKRELDEFRARGKKRHDTLRALAASLRRRAAAFATLPPGVLADLDPALDRLNAASGALARAVWLANAGGIRLAAIGRKSLPG